MSFFDVHYLQRKILELMDEGLAIQKESEKGNTHNVVKHHKRLKHIFYVFIRHYKLINSVTSISLVMLGAEQLTKFLDCLSSIHNIMIEYFPTINLDIPDIDLRFHIDLAREIKEIVARKKRLII